MRRWGSPTTHKREATMISKDEAEQDRIEQYIRRDPAEDVRRAEAIRNEREVQRLARQKAEEDRITRERLAIIEARERVAHCPHCGGAL